MTTATEAPPEGVTNEELEAWLNGDIEKPCGLYYVYPYRHPCGQPANWLMYYKNKCEHPHPGSCFLCDACHAIAIYNPSFITCSNCPKSLEIKFIERIRG